MGSSGHGRGQWNDSSPIVAHQRGHTYFLDYRRCALTNWRWNDFTIAHNVMGRLNFALVED